MINVDQITHLHLHRVSEYLEIFLQGYNYIGDKDELIFASRVHDIGKILIPYDIINKKGKLTITEYDTAKTHTTLGHKLLKNDYPYSAMIALQHHENVDGTGYPYGLTRDDIYEGALITSICDVFDALTSKRSYKDKWTLEESLEYIISQRGKKFDEKMVDHFVTLRHKMFDKVIELKEVDNVFNIDDYINIDFS